MSEKRPSRSSDTRAKYDHSLAIGYVRGRANAWLAEDLTRTRAALARLAGLTAEQVHELLNSSRTPTQRSMRAVARALGIEYDDLETAVKQWAQRSPDPEPPTAGDNRYPNRARAIKAALLVDHDARDIATVREVVLPPGVADPSALVWLRWIDRAREEREARKGR